MRGLEQSLELEQAMDLNKASKKIPSAVTLNWRMFFSQPNRFWFTELILSMHLGIFVCIYKCNETLTYLNEIQKFFNLQNPFKTCPRQIKIGSKRPMAASATSTSTARRCESNALSQALLRSWRATESNIWYDWRSTFCRWITFATEPNSLYR